MNDLEKDIKEAIHFLNEDIPVDFYESLIILFCLGCVSIFAFLGIKKGIIYVLRLLLLEYVSLLFTSTILLRTVSESRGHNFIPLWSYEAIMNGRSELVAENILNTIVFLPVGMLLALAIPKWIWWRAIGIGFLISFSIEVIQLATKRGFCEFDDVIHNTLGCVIGYGIAKLIILSFMSLNNREHNEGN